MFLYVYGIRFVEELLSLLHSQQCFIYNAMLWHTWPLLKDCSSCNLNIALTFYDFNNILINCSACILNAIHALFPTGWEYFGCDWALVLCIKRWSQNSIKFNSLLFIDIFWHFLAITNNPSCITTALCLEQGQPWFAYSLGQPRPIAIRQVSKDASVCGWVWAKLN